MTPGTKVRTKVSLVAEVLLVAANSEGTVVATHSHLPFPVEVQITHLRTTSFYRSDELETIE